MKPIDPTLAARADVELDTLLDLPAAERLRRIAELRAENAELATLVGRLLHAVDEDSTGPLEAVSELARVHMATRGGETELSAGDQVGSWRIVAPLAHGGMSRVYVAERTAGGFLQRAALKQFRAGGEWSESLARRFEQERQLLAALEDPDIARVLDGGVGPDGRPYLVMELVDGVPIDEHCSRFGLALRERVALIQRTARAVQHAHRHLVVHRDIKPSNVLVTAQGAVKLLDFGIAKVLEGSSALGSLALAAPETRTTARPLTPAYASPEQVRGTPITTASDVYQLGLLAYELLDGEPAHRFQNGSFREFERVVCEADPPRLGGRAARLTGTEERPVRVPPDLETIIFKALAKDPERRYASAEQFAEDLGRFLADQPVLARRDTAWYRTRKFVRRHRVATVAAGVIGAVVLSAAVALAALSRRLAIERDRAHLEAKKSAEVAQFLVGLFEANDPEERLGESLTARDLLDRGAARLETQVDLDPRLRAAMQLHVAEMNLLIGRAEIAEPIARRALEAASGFGDGSPGAQAGALHLLSWSADLRGDFAAAERLARAAIASALTELPADDPRLALYSLALGSALDGLHRSRDAIEVYTETVERLRRSGGNVVTLADALAGLGLARLDLGDLAGAEQATREALNLLAATFGVEHLRTAWARNNLGRVLERRGALAEAHELYTTSLAMKRQLYGEEHASTAVALHNLARVDAALGHWDEAVIRNAEAHRIRAARLGSEHPATLISLMNQGIFERERMQFDLARTAMARAFDGLARKLGEDHRQATFARVYGGLLLLDVGRPVEAALAVPAAERLLAGDSPRDRVPAAVFLGRLARAQGRPEAAHSNFERAVAEGVALGEPLYRPALEAAFLLALERDRRAGLRSPSADLLRAAAAIRERSPRLHELARDLQRELARN